MANGEINIETFKGKLVNNVIACRDGDDILFLQRGDGTVVANLEGYAIVPVETTPEEFAALVRNDP